MSQIISISMSNDDADELDALQDSLQYSNRSELLRAGLKSLVAEKKELPKKGKGAAVLLVSFDHKGEHSISQIKHSFDHLVTTQIHHHFRQDHKCFEVYILEGNFDKINEFFLLARKNKNIHYAKLIVL